MSSFIIFLVWALCSLLKFPNVGFIGCEQSNVGVSYLSVNFHENLEPIINFNASIVLIIPTEDEVCTIRLGCIQLKNEVSELIRLQKTE